MLSAPVGQVLLTVRGQIHRRSVELERAMWFADRVRIDSRAISLWYSEDAVTVESPLGRHKYRIGQ